LDRRLGGPQSRSGRGGEEKNSQPLPGIEPKNPDRPARSPALEKYKANIRSCNHFNKKTRFEVEWVNFAHRHMRSTAQE